MIIRSQFMGMCLAVRNAIERIENLNRPDEVCIYGELVHNQQVLNSLLDYGIKMISEVDRKILPKESQVLVTPHGICDKDRNWLLECGKTLIDCTCPFVRMIHKKAKDLHNQGYFIVIIGKRNHVEVKGLCGDLDHFKVISSIGEVECYPDKQIAVLTQSTCQEKLTIDIVEQVKHLNPHKEIKFYKTICKPALDRQRALNDVLKKVKALVVVGGYHSNNTKELVKLAEFERVRTFHVERSEELDTKQLASYSLIGLTAGTSTPQSTIDEVYQKLLLIHNQRELVSMQC